MKKLILGTLFAATSIAGLVVGTQGQLFSMAASGLRHVVDHQARDQFETNRVHQLGTQPSFSVLAAGDIANCGKKRGWDRISSNLRYSFGLGQPAAVLPEQLRETTRILGQYPDALIFALGDLAYENGAPADFEECYTPSWGMYRDRTWAVPGNHEYKSHAAYGYFDYWDTHAGPDRKGYYALKAANWIILALNSEIDAGAGSPQADWINKVTGAYPDSCLAAFYHKPAYSSLPRSKTDNARALFAQLADLGASFVLNGHNHFYARSVPMDASGVPSDRGMVAFTVGTGGQTVDHGIDRIPFENRLILGASGVLSIDFTPQGAAWTYLDATGADQLESGASPCRSGPI